VPTTNFDLKKVWERFFGLLGATFGLRGLLLAFVVVTRIEIIVLQRNQIEIGGKKLTVLQKMSLCILFF